MPAVPADLGESKKIGQGLDMRKQALPKDFRSGLFQLVGLTGFEPATP